MQVACINVQDMYNRFGTVLLLLCLRQASMVNALQRLSSYGPHLVWALEQFVEDMNAKLFGDVVKYIGIGLIETMLQFATCIFERWKAVRTQILDEKGDSLEIAIETPRSWEELFEKSALWVCNSCTPIGGPCAD